MKRIIFDTNVVLDVLLDRKPYVEENAAAWTAVENGIAEGLVAAHTVTTIHYLIRKETGNVKQQALQLPIADFEDAVTAAAARLAGCDCIVTRDPNGFRGSLVRCLPPKALTSLLGAE